MESGRTVGRGSTGSSMLLLAIDTCGPAGSVALARLTKGRADAETCGRLEILGEAELEGRSYHPPWSLLSAIFWQARALASRMPVRLSR